MYKLNLIFILFTFTQEQNYFHSSKDSGETTFMRFKGNIFLFLHFRGKNIRSRYLR